MGIDVPEGCMDCGLELDTDLYPLEGGKNEVFALEIYDDLLATVRAILEGNIYYKSTAKVAITARKIKANAYTVNYMQGKKIIFLKYASGWRDRIYDESEFNKLGLTVLS